MRVLAVALAVGLLAAACSGDDDVAITTAPVITSDTLFVTTTTDSPPTTVTDPTTVPSSTAPGTTTLAPATAAPPTTDPEIEQVRQDVVAALVVSWEAFDAVLRDPTNQEKNAELQQLMTEAEYQEVFDTFLVKYVANDLAERTNPDVPATVVPYMDTFEFDPNSMSASMEYCFVSTNQLVQIQPDGTEVLQDDRVAAVHELSRFQFLDGAWVDSGGFTIEVFDGEVACPGV